MNKTTIKAEVVADSLSPQGDRLTSLKITFPRIILAEVNTHRMLSKNTSSSRAIPFKKMVEAVLNNPFIPIAWQKSHSGMQGTEYLSKTKKYNLVGFITTLTLTLHDAIEGSEEYDKLAKELDEKLEIIKTSLKPYTTITKTLDEWWLLARDKAVETASIMYVFGVTKQLCNRLLEPFMWTTMLITGSNEGWDNFFRLRCPQYHYDLEDKHFYSKKQWLDYYRTHCIGDPNSNFELDEMDWFNINKGQAEIHIMDLAEKIYNAMNESTPKQLKSGEWHIPFYDKINLLEKDLPGKSGTAVRWNISKGTQIPLNVLVSTAMAARVSYTIVGDEKEIDYQKQLELHDRLISQDPPHSSPFEHCARAMSDEEFYSYIRSNGEVLDKTEDGENIYSHRSFGWCRNFKGFIPYRYMIYDNLEI